MSYNLIRTYETFQAFKFEISDIKYHIGSFLFNSEVFEGNTINSEILNKAYFNVWKEKMKETLSAIDKGWKYIAVYEDEDGNTTECVNCYLKSFLLKTTYVDDCENCYGLWYDMPTDRYDLVNFEYIKKTTCLFQKEYFSVFNIEENARTILINSKYLAEQNLYLDEYNLEYIWLDRYLGLYDEIHFGPIHWTSSLEKKPILKKMYPNSYEQYKHPIPSCAFTEDTMDDLYPIRYY